MLLLLRLLQLLRMLPEILLSPLLSPQGKLMSIKRAQWDSKLSHLSLFSVSLSLPRKSLRLPLSLLLINLSIQAGVEKRAGARSFTQYYDLDQLTGFREN